MEDASVTIFHANLTIKPAAFIVREALIALPSVIHLNIKVSKAGAPRFPALRSHILLTFYVFEAAAASSRIGKSCHHD